MHDRWQHPAKGFASRFLTFDSGARIELMTTTTLAPLRAMLGAQRMGLTQLALALGSPQMLDSCTERLRAAGKPVLDGPRRTGYG